MDDRELPGQADWVGPNNESENSQGQQYLVSGPGIYRLAVRYHWWANTQGGRAGTAWHWAGPHFFPYPAKPAKYCSFSS